MRRTLTIVFICACVPLTLAAQRPTFGLAVGYSFVGGADTRTIVSTGAASLTGADRAGIHVRAMAEWPLRTDALRFRMELFYNRLTSGANSAAIVGTSGTLNARVDRTVGAMETLVAAPISSRAFSPYFLVGLGAFESHLVGQPGSGYQGRGAAAVDGMGLGLQAGIGLRYRIGSVPLMVEWRYAQALNDTRGISFMPLTVGIAF